MAADFADVIGPETQVRGSITGSAPLLVRGAVEGTVSLQAELLVAAEGQVSADIQGTVITIEGRADGTIAATERVVLRDGCNVSATIRTPALVMEDGAHMTGDIEMEVALPAGVERG